MRKTIDYDKVIAEILELPKIKENVAKMTPGELNWFKELLIWEGICDQYIEEKKTNACL
jgi:hypothetical protein